MNTERTFAIIKPDAVERGLAGQVLARIHEAGFTVRERGTAATLVADVGQLVHQDVGTGHGVGLGEQ